MALLANGTKVKLVNTNSKQIDGLICTVVGRGGSYSWNTSSLQFYIVQYPDNFRPTGYDYPTTIVIESSLQVVK